MTWPFFISFSILCHKYQKINVNYHNLLLKKNTLKSGKIMSATGKSQGNFFWDFTMNPVGMDWNLNGIDGRCNYLVELRNYIVWYTLWRSCSLGTMMNTCSKSTAGQAENVTVNRVKLRSVICISVKGGEATFLFYTRNNYILRLKVFYKYFYNKYFFIYRGMAYYRHVLYCKTSIKSAPPHMELYASLYQHSK